MGKVLEFYKEHRQTICSIALLAVVLLNRDIRIACITAIICVGELLLIYKEKKDGRVGVSES